jgi:hypothetical protein
MCLNIDYVKGRPKRVVNRWKFLNQDTMGRLLSPARDFEWMLDKLNTANISYSLQGGFHVYLTRRDAERAARRWPDLNKFSCNKRRVIVKLKVSGFLATGTINKCDDYSDGRTGEIWSSAKIVGIYELPQHS